LYDLVGIDVFFYPYGRLDLVLTGKLLEIRMPGTYRYRLITFDVYTALFDIEGSLVPLVGQVLDPQADSLSFVRLWRKMQLEYALISNSLGKERVPFQTITRRALGYTLSQVGADVTETGQEHLMMAWQKLELWPEAEEVLTTLKARGYLMGLLSNGDEIMLEALAARLPVLCDHIFSSEQARVYKPHPGIYALPLRSLGLAPEEVLHVAGSRTDVMGAKAAGLRCAWSNRQADKVIDPKYEADYEFENLSGLLDLL
jgi:2-haloacid dehalogenase